MRLRYHLTVLCVLWAGFRGLLHVLRGTHPKPFTFQVVKSVEFIALPEPGPCARYFTCRWSRGKRHAQRCPRFIGPWSYVFTDLTREDVWPEYPKTLYENIDWNKAIEDAYRRNDEAAKNLKVTLVNDPSSYL